MKKIFSPVLAGCVIIAFAHFGCSQTQHLKRDVEKPSAISVQAMESTATIVAIDYENRTGTVMLADGTTETFHARLEVKDFDQVKVGDQVILKGRPAR